MRFKKLDIANLVPNWAAEIQIRMGAGRLVQLVAAIFSFLFICNCASAANAAPLVFFGDKALPPYEFLEDGMPKGANVDLAQAIGTVLGRPVEVRLMPWADAQEALLAGEGHALTMLGKTKGREPKFDFSVPTLPVAFTLFIRAGDEARFATASLEGKRIGVISGGLPESYIAAQHPAAIRVVVPNGTEGARLLLRGNIDALAANQWSQLYLLRELNISGITPLTPFNQRQGNIAVRKGDTALLQQIDSALETLKQNGEFDRIIDRWSSKRVHLLSESMVERLFTGGIAITLLVMLLAFTAIRLRAQKRILVHEVEERREIEKEREQIVNALRMREQELEEADRRKDEFLATLSHELRNPLASIQYAVEVQRLQKDPAAQAHTHGVIERQVKQLVHLVDDLLEISRIAAGKVRLRMCTVNIAEAIENAIESNRTSIERAHQHLSVDLPPEPLLVDGDLTRLTQVIANLISNAVKYTSPHGHIWITGRRHEGNILLTVRDDGIGIPPQMLTNVFEMFSQVDRSLGRSHGGLGIGLALARKLVGLHGGTIQAHSDGEGCGATLTVSLPAATNISARIPANDDASGSRTEGRRRLVVIDDNIDNAETLKMLLEAVEYEVTTAHDGQQAVELAEKLRPDVMIVDIGLPDMSGYDVARRVRSTPWGSDLVLIALTGWGQTQDRLKSEQAGFNRHFTKPVALNDLQAALKQLIKNPECCTSQL